MPHITLEYSSNLKLKMKDIPGFFSIIHTALQDTLGVELLNCKSRVIRRKNFHIADGDENHAFAHLEIKILEGRSEEEKADVGSKTMDILKDYFAEASYDFVFQPSVELTEIPAGNYFKLSADEILGS